MSQLEPLLDAVRVFANQDGSDLFSPSVIAQIAALPDADRSLVAIIADGGQPIARRFAAVEALLQKGLGKDVDDPATTAAVTDVVVLALPLDTVHNRWGLPGTRPGRLARRVLKLPGFDAARLSPLLAIDKPLEILGSEAATIQHRHRYRIADLAAFLIATARGVPYPDDPDPAMRDRFIATLRP